MTGLTYQAVHQSLRRTRGRASEHACISCGGKAQEWAYDHEDPHEVQVVHRGRLVAISADLAHYEPRCCECHRYYDLAVIETSALA